MQTMGLPSTTTATVSSASPFVPAAGIMAVTLSGALFTVLWGLHGLDDWPWSVAMFLIAACTGIRFLTEHDGTVIMACSIGVMMLSALHMTMSGGLLLPGDLLLPAMALLAGEDRHPAVRRIGFILVWLPGMAMLGHLLWTENIGPVQCAVALLPSLAQFGSWLIGRWKFGIVRMLHAAEADRSSALRDNIGHARLAAMEERLRITREMHDILAHTLTAIVVQAEGGRTVAHDDDSAATFAAIARSTREAMSDIRGLLNHVDSQQPVPEPGLADVPSLIARFRSEGMSVAYAHDGHDPTVPPGLGLGIYRVTEECLTNAMRHGARRQALVVLDTDAERGMITLMVENPTVASPSIHGPRKPYGEGRGLTAMRLRCAQYGGTVSFAATDGRFTVHATWSMAAASWPSPTDAMMPTPSQAAWEGM